MSCVSPSLAEFGLMPLARQMTCHLRRIDIKAALAANLRHDLEDIQSRLKRGRRKKRPKIAQSTAYMWTEPEPNQTDGALALVSAWKDTAGVHSYPWQKLTLHDVPYSDVTILGVLLGSKICDIILTRDLAPGGTQDQWARIVLNCAPT